MNNPALPGYPSQNPGPYAAAAFSNPQLGGLYAPSTGPPFDHAQTPFQPMIPNHMQRPSHSQQPHQPIPQQFYQQQTGPVGAFPQPGHHSNAGTPFPGQPSSNRLSPAPLNPGSRQGSNPNIPQLPPATPSQAPAASSTPIADSNMAAAIGLQGQPNATLAQQAQMQNAAQATRTGGTPQQQQQQQPQVQPMSPQSAARERARVSVLLEINTHLLQEVVSLQAQGKAGTIPTQGQQSPTSPTSATDPSNALNNSPGEPPKSAGGGQTANASKPPSQEYADCMRRLQANLSYLAAIADAKKKNNGALPSGPAIMAPPAHLAPVHDLYKKLNALFPEANKGGAQSGAQGQNSIINAGMKQQQVPTVSAQG